MNVATRLPFLVATIWFTFVCTREMSSVEPVPADQKSFQPGHKNLQYSMAPKINLQFLVQGAKMNSRPPQVLQGQPN
jgi:hypothetical protein